MRTQQQRTMSIILISSCMPSIGTGIMLSFPSVLNPDILSPNGTIHATPDQASWIAGSNAISGFFGFCMAPYIMKNYGRKTVHIGINFFTALGFLTFSLATNISCLYAARILQGIKICGIYVTSFILAEYSHQKRRGYFIVVKKTMVPLGSLLCHALGMCWTWRQIATLAIFANVIAIILTFLWPESPSFLALTKKFDECEKSHKWLFGDSQEKKRELEELILSQREATHTNNDENSRDVFKKLLGKDFMKPFIISCLLTIIIDACGRFYMIAYIIQILTDVTQNKSIAVYCTVGSDILTFVALLVSMILIRRCRRRTLLFSCGSTCALSMCLISVLTFLKSRYNIGESIFWWFIPSLILLNVFLVNVGLTPISYTVISEIFPLEHKGRGICATGIVFTVLYFFVMKLTPTLMANMGVEGVFGIYGLIAATGLLVLHFILSETKDRPLIEIEKEFRGDKRSRLYVDDNNLNSKPLI